MFVLLHRWRAGDTSRSGGHWSLFTFWENARLHSVDYSATRRFQSILVLAKQTVLGVLQRSSPTGRCRAGRGAVRLVAKRQSIGPVAMVHGRGWTREDRPVDRFGFTARATVQVDWLVVVREDLARSTARGFDNSAQTNEEQLVLAFGFQQE